MPSRSKAQPAQSRSIFHMNLELAAFPAEGSGLWLSIFIPFEADRTLG
jgi:hypothetical protein